MSWTVPTVQFIAALSLPSWQLHNLTDGAVSDIVVDRSVGPVYRIKSGRKQRPSL
ncbi:MAG: hypothetical protein JNL67_17330 [Planctomycetaceae bacterium]|nr:hypothetical protein [Planctomycetaceae bacterium]